MQNTFKPVNESTNNIQSLYSIKNNISQKKVITEELHCIFFLITHSYNTLNTIIIQVL